jgi:uncharacterized membrane protein
MIHLMVIGGLWAYVEWVSRSATPEARRAALIRWHRVVFTVVITFALTRLAIRAAFNADIVGDHWIPAARSGVGVASGLLLAAWGNYLPKLLSPWNQEDEPFDWQRVHRFAGWLATIGGLAVAVIWLALPVERAAAVSRVVLLTVFVLAIGRKLLSIASTARAWR